MRDRVIAMGLLLLAGAAQAQLPECLSRGGPFHVYHEAEEDQQGPLAIVRHVQFTNVNHLPVTEQKKIAASLRGKHYYDSDWREQLVDKVRYAWQIRGYFRVEAKPSYRVVSGTGSTKRIAATFNVREGSRYRFGGISFRNVTVFRPEELSKVFPLRPGEIFGTDKVRQGLESLRRLYGAKGYLNFTSVPDTQIDDDRRRIALEIDVDEGKQFLFGDVKFVGLDPATTEQLRQEWKPKRGEPFNGEYVYRFWAKHRALFPPDLPPENMTTRSIDVRRQTVDVVFQFSSHRFSDICEFIGIDPRLYQKTSDDPR